VLVAAWPGPRVHREPGPLRDLILASAAVPYAGEIDSVGNVLLPDLPGLRELATLFSSSTRMRAWYATPTSWRVAVLDRLGERDTYRTGSGTYLWDFERNLTTFTAGELPVRPPRAADLLPPDLARRLLAGSAADGGPLTALPARRVAGIAAAGLRWTPADPDTTIGQVDVWADPDSGLPVQVEVGRRGADRTVIRTRFLELDQRRPATAVLLPRPPDSADFVTASAADVAEAVGNVAPIPLPGELAGRPATRIGGFQARAAGVALYGSGVSTFAVLALGGRVGGQALEAARRRGGVPVRFDGPSVELDGVPDGVSVRLDPAEGYESQSTGISALIVRAAGPGRRRPTYVLAGFVTPELLRGAAGELLGRGLG
jgi:hypothetical protein